MTVDAIVLEIRNNRLLVRDLSNNQEILVNTRNARRFSPDDLIRITSNGQMTFSIPPQITAISIQRIQRPTPPTPSTSSELRATVVQIRGNLLLVREIGTNRQFLIDYRNACRFRVRQRISIRYETIFINESPNPSRIIALSITPLR